MHKSRESFQRSIISQQLGEGYDIRICADEIKAVVLYGKYLSGKVVEISACKTDAAL
jgi:hypothetical protein